MATQPLSKAEMEETMTCLKRQYPTLEEQADFEMENVREVVLWLRPLWKDSKRQSTALALVAAMFTQFRMHLTADYELREADPEQFQLYAPDSSPTPMAVKLCALDVPTSQIETKIRELRAAIDWMKPMLDSPAGFRIRAVMQGCYVTLADSLPHLICFTQMMQTEDGVLKNR